MLDSMRNLAKTPVAKMLLGTLVISFAIWGVRGLVVPRVDTSIARVGKFEVTQQDFQRVFERELDSMRRQFGDSFSAEQARAFGLDGQILKGLIAAAALDESARRLGLSTPDDAIIKQTRETEAFFGPDGRFSQARFQEVLRQSGYQEATFIEAMRRDMTRQQLQETLALGFEAPIAMSKPLYEFQREQRVVRYIVLTADAAGDSAEPTDDAIKAYYETNKAAYRTPEYRKISYVLLSPTEIAATLTVDEEKARDYFEFHKDEFGSPETRTIEQIVYPNESAAQTARAAIGGGQSFTDAATSAGYGANDINLGTFPAKGFPKAIADVAFALAKDKVSDPIKTDFGWALVRVTAINAGSEASFEDSRAAVEAKIAKDEADEKVYELGNSLEDKRQAGQSLEDAAKSIGAQTRVIDMTDAKGLRRDGSPVAELDGQPELLTEAFKAVPSQDSGLVPTAGGGYVAFRVDGITPPADQPLDAVKDKVRDALVASTRMQALEAKSKDILARAKAGTSLDALARELGRVVQTSEPIKRGAANETFSREAIDALFAAPENGFAAGPVGLGESRMVMQVTKIVLPTQDDLAKDMPQVRKALSGLFGNEAMATYAVHAEGVIKVKFNDKIWKGMFPADGEAATP